MHDAFPRYQVDIVINSYHNLHGIGFNFQTVSLLREHLTEKTFLSGIARKGGGALFHHVTIPYTLTSISYYVILLGHF